MWILPTRGRPSNIQRLFNQWYVVQSSTPGIVAVDEDDPCLAAYLDVALPHNWQWVVCPRMSMCEKVNYVQNLNPGMSWYGYIDDDAFPHTYQWDAKLVEAAGSDKIAYPRNGIGDEALASQFVIGGEFVRNYLGPLFLPGLKRLYGDNYITDVGRHQRALVYKKDIFLEQLHFSNGKAEFDSTYEKPEAAEDKQVYEAWREAFFGSLAVVCVNYQNYQGLGERYVKTLQSLVAQHLTIPYRFYCVTENPIEGVDCLTDINPTWNGWWQKLTIFKPGLFREERVLYLDLDTYVVDNLDFVTSCHPAGCFTTLRDPWRSGRQLAAGVMLFNPGHLTKHIYEHALALQSEKLTFENDQIFLGNFFSANAYEFLTFQELHPKAFVSYKDEAINEIPKDAAVVYFHGVPRPHEAEGWAAQVWKSPKKIELELFCNVVTEKLLANVTANLQSAVPTILFAAEHDKHAVIIGGGASLIDSLDEIRTRDFLGQVIFSLNNSAKYLTETGIHPDYQVIVDARPENVDFVHPTALKLLASQCDPCLFKQAHPLVNMWHAQIDGLAEILEDTPHTIIGGGTTVGLSAMCLAYAMGFRKLHLYGYDSSHSEDKRGHAYEQPLNATDQLVEVAAYGKWFTCSITMAKQAELFSALCYNLSELGVIITVHGNGLIPHIAKYMTGNIYGK